MICEKRLQYILAEIVVRNIDLNLMPRPSCCSKYYTVEHVVSYLAMRVLIKACNENDCIKSDRILLPKLGID